MAQNLRPLGDGESNDAEVGLEDQKNINEFGRLNNRTKELKEDLLAISKKLEEYDDAATELAVWENESDR